MSTVEIHGERSTDVSGEIKDTAAAWKRCEGMEQNARNLGAERLTVGRRLNLLRRHWPASGPKAKGWGEALAKIGIAERTARAYMALAAFVDKGGKIPAAAAEIEDVVSLLGASVEEPTVETPPSTPPPPTEVPTMAEAGVDKRPRKKKEPEAYEVSVDQPARAAKQTHEHPEPERVAPGVDSPRSAPAPAASNPSAPAEMVVGRDAKLEALRDDITALSPEKKLLLAAELTAHGRIDVAHQIAIMVVNELGAALLRARPPQDEARA